jgi:tetratricopeptide (TPR) repeat protein
MTNKKNLIIFAAIFITIAGFSGWYIYRDLKKHPAVVTVVKHPVSNTNTNIPVSNISSASPNTENTEEIKKQMPDLDREIIVKDSTLSEESKNRAILEIKKITEALKTDYDRREEWLNLGLWRKTIGDYEGAEEAWKFVTIIRPNDPVAYHNLGDLYSQYLPDFPKAEKYYLLAIEKDTSHQPFFYIKLYEFYRYYLKKPDLAEKALLDGLKTNPGNEYLQKTLNDFRNEK